MTVEYRLTSPESHFTAFYKYCTECGITSTAGVKYSTASDEIAALSLILIKFNATFRCNFDYNTIMSIIFDTEEDMMIFKLKF